MSAYVSNVRSRALNSDAVPSEMLEHYREVQESERLSEGIGELERLRTKTSSEDTCQDPAPEFLTSEEARVCMLCGWLAKDTKFI
jgi:hypothetical protein